jgi:hypothetical protein
VEEQADRERIRQQFTLEKFKENFEKNITLFGWEYRTRNADGTYGWHYVSAGLYRNELDEEIYAFIRIRDVTRKHQLGTDYGVHLELHEYGLFYELDIIGKMSDAILARQNGKTYFTLALLKFTNYDDMLVKYGKLLIDDLVFGFLGKTMMILKAENLTCYDGKGTMTIMLPEETTAESADELMEAIMKFLKDPAYIQYREEMSMQYRYALAVPDENMRSFEALYDSAAKALAEASVE